MLLPIGTQAVRRAGLSVGHVLSQLHASSSISSLSSSLPSSSFVVNSVARSACLYRHSNLRPICKCMSRGFSSHADQSSHSIEGRYGYALLAASQSSKAVDKVYADMQGIQELLNTSSDFNIFTKTPTITPEMKVDIINRMADRFQLHPITRNFLCTLVENKRMTDLPKIIKFFEELYRHSRGEIRCFITSANELTSAQKKEVIAALQKRAGPKKTILAEFQTSSNISGGLLVRMEDELLDYTVSSQLESIRSALMAPLSA